MENYKSKASRLEAERKSRMKKGASMAKNTVEKINYPRDKAILDTSGLNKQQLVALQNLIDTMK